MNTIRRNAWLITLVSLAVLLLARSLRKDLGSRRQIIDEAAPRVQAGSAGGLTAPSIPKVTGAVPIAQPLRPSPWSIVADGGTGAKLLGTVVDSDGAPIAGRALSFWDGKEARVVRADDRGRFAFETSVEGSFELVGLGADPAALPLHTTSYHAHPGTSLRGVTLHAFTAQELATQARRRGDDDAGSLDPSNQIVGRVQLAGGGDAVGAFVVIVRRLVAGLEAQAVVHRTVLDARGHFDVRGLPPGDYIVQAFASGLAPAQAHASVPVPLAQAELVLELAPGGEVRGQVLGDPGREPLSAANVSLDAGYNLGMYPPTVHQQTTTDAQGRFSLPGIGAAHASLQASAPGRIPQVRPQLRLTAGQVTQVELLLRSADAEPKGASARRP